MNKKTFVKTLIILLFVTLSFVLLAKPYVEKTYAVSCPAGMTLQACLTYLENEQEKLEEKEGSIRNNLRDEEYQQLSLQEKINYITNQVTQTEKVIKTLEVEIAATNIEIKLFEIDIIEREDYISLLKQETDILEQTVNQRITESYKYSFVGPLEIFLDVKSLSSALRRTKYLIATRSQDIVSLEEYSFKIEDLRKQENELTIKKADLQIKRNSIEEEKLKLASENKNLEAQKNEKNKLLAESKTRESEYRKQLAEVSKAITQTDNAVIQVIMQLFNSGQLGNGANVTAGNYIGFEGHTGCSFGSHLHFEIRLANGQKVNPLDGYLSYSGGYVRAGSLKAPMDNAYLTQGYRPYSPYYHYAIDLVHLDDNFNRYTVKYGICPTVDRILNERKASGLSDYNKAYLRGEGKPVRAVASGKVYYGVDLYGGKWALVVHKSDQKKSFYLHLK